MLVKSKSPLPLIHGPEDISPAWFNSVLSAAGFSAEVANLKVTPVGTGQMASSFRVTPVYRAANSEDGEPPPSSVVIKMTSINEGSREVGAGGEYACEVNFYLHFAERVDIRVPHCFYGQISEDGAEFVLVLEDMAPAAQGDQIAGCSVKQIDLALSSLAGLHASTWQMDWPIDGCWQPAPKKTVDEISDYVRLLLPVFTDRYAGQIDSSNRMLLELFSDAAGDWWDKQLRSRPLACIHADYRADNLLFGANDKSLPICVVDWQSVTLGAPGIDLAHLMGTSLEPAMRRASEQRLLAHYHRELSARGVSDYSAEECFDDYRRALFYPILVAVFCAASVERTERGDEMFLTMFNHACAAIKDLSADSFLR